jgi:hypothetical protein
MGKGDLVMSRLSNEDGNSMATTTRNPVEDVSFLFHLGLDWGTKVSMMSLAELVALRERFNAELLATNEPVDKMAIAFMMSVVSAYIEDEKSGGMTAYALGAIEGPMFLRDSTGAAK